MIPLKPLSDSRLTRSLTLSEFIMAFSIYKNVMCEAYPIRRTELDAYELNIVEMSHKFGGSAFYEYHRSFSARAAAMLQNYNIKINWAIKDTNLFCMTFAGRTALTCGQCNSLAHTTQFCPQNIGKNQNTPHFGISTVGGNQKLGTNRGIDIKGRNRVSHKGRELCNNYNSSAGCDKPNCQYWHICIKCRAPGHPMALCKGANSSANQYVQKPDTRHKLHSKST